MRYSRNQRTGRQTSGSKGAVFAVCLIVLAIAVYLIGANKVGNFISDQIVVPVVAWVTGEQPVTNEATPSDEAVQPSESSNAEAETTERIQLEVGKVYALQAGVFADEQNARNMAQNLQQKGGAGYTVSDEQSYRVLIAGYKTLEEANSVKQRLLSEQNMQTKVFEMESPAITLHVTADAQALGILREAAAQSLTAQQALLQLSLSLDKNDVTAEKAQTLLAQYAEEAENIKNKVDEIDIKTDNIFVQKLSKYYGSVAKACQSAAYEEGAVALSSGIKYAYLEIAAARMQLTVNA